MSRVLSESFVRLAAGGRAGLDDIDASVSEWHEGKEDVPLHEFLGMTRHEYALWVDEPEFLALIVAAHKDGRSLEELVDDPDALLAAGGPMAPDLAAKLKKWLDGRADRGG